MNFPKMQDYLASTLRIKLNANRMLDNIEVIVSSGNWGYDGAVVRAVRKTDEFPAECPEEFIFTFWKNAVKINNSDIRIGSKTDTSETQLGGKQPVAQLPENAKENTEATIMWNATPYSYQNGKAIHNWQREFKAKSVSLLPNGRHMLTTYSHENDTDLLDIKTGKVLQSWRHSDQFYIKFSPDGRQVLTVPRSLKSHTMAVLRDLQTGKSLHTWQEENTGFQAAFFSPNGRQIFTINNQTVVTRDVQTGKILHTWLHQETRWSVAFAPDGRNLVTGTDAKTAVLRDIQTGKTVQTWRHDGEVMSATFSPDGRQVLTVSDDKTATLRDVQTGKTVQIWRHAGSVNSVAFSPDGRHLAIGSDDKTAVLRDVKTGKTLKIWPHERSVNSVVFSPDGQHVVTGSDDKTAVLRDIKTSNIVKIWQHEREVQNVALSSDGRHLLTRYHDNSYVIRPSGLTIRSPLKDAIIVELREAEKIYRTLPATLADRQSSLENARPEKDEFETTAQFNIRVVNWNMEVEKLNGDIKSHYAKLGPLPFDLRVAAFNQAINYSYGNPELHDIRYDPDLGRFFATLRASNDPEFKRTVSIAVPNVQARDAKKELESADDNNLVVELRVTDKNELIWGGATVKLNGVFYSAQYTDKDFTPPATQQATKSAQFQDIGPPSISIFPAGPEPRVGDDANLVKLQTEVLRKEREQQELNSRQAEEKRLKDRLTELNRTRTIEFSDDLPSLLAKIPKAQPNPNIYVLAVGIHDYADVPDVPFADRYANQFAEIVQALLGAQKQNVIVLTNSEATSGRLRGRIRTLLNRLGPQDQMLFYYAGHGVPSKDGTSTYLLAQDGGPGSYEEPDLRLSQLYAAIAQSKVGKAKLFIDACFSGRSGKNGSVFEGIAPVAVRPSHSLPDAQRIVVLTAGRGDQFSNQDKNRGHRLFSYHLMRVLLEDGLKLKISQIYKRLRARVLNDSLLIGPEFEQEPELFGNGQLVISD